MKKARRIALVAHDNQKKSLMNSDYKPAPDDFSAYLGRKIGNR
jgi:methylglyoxal synthase